MYFGKTKLCVGRLFPPSLQQEFILTRRQLFSCLLEVAWDSCFGGNRKDSSFFFLPVLCYRKTSVFACTYKKLIFSLCAINGLWPASTPSSIHHSAGVREYARLGQAQHKLRALVAGASHNLTRDGDKQTHFCRTFIACEWIIPVHKTENLLCGICKQQFCS